MILLKVHYSGERGNHRFVIAVCDNDLIGKTLTEGKLQIHVSEHFYKGEAKNEGEILTFLKDATNVNFLGEEAISLGLRSGIISQKHIIRIAGVPHAQAVSF